MKLRITGAAGLFDAWLAVKDDIPPMLWIKWPDDNEVMATVEVANQRCSVVWATAEERQKLKAAGFAMRGQDDTRRTTDDAGGA